MPVRMMLYDGLNYTEQIRQLDRNKKFKNSDEFLSGMKKDDKLLPIVTIVFYYGEKEKIDMCEALQGIFDDGVELGMKQGISLAKQIFQMWKEGRSEEEIADQCNISLQKVKEFLE